MEGRITADHLDVIWAAAQVTCRVFNHPTTVSCLVSSAEPDDTLPQSVYETIIVPTAAAIKIGRIFDLYSKFCFVF